MRTCGAACALDTMADEKDVQSHHVHDDLAAAPKMQILYEDLRVTATTTGKDKETVSKDILKGISGVIQPGRLTAVMGSSGAGKTTFLNVLVSIGMVTRTQPLSQQLPVRHLVQRKQLESLHDKPSLVMLITA